MKSGDRTAAEPFVNGRSKPLTTGAVCRAAQVTRGQLRLYEEAGLLPTPTRSGNGYRCYAPDTLDRLFAIRQLKEVGFTLAQIALLLSERDAGEMDLARIQELAREQLIVIDNRISNLQLVREFTEAVAGGDMSALNDSDCRFLIQFMASGRLRPVASGR